MATLHSDERNVEGQLPWGGMWGRKLGGGGGGAGFAPARARGAEGAAEREEWEGGGALCALPGADIHQCILPQQPAPPPSLAAGQVKHPSCQDIPGSQKRWRASWQGGPHQAGPSGVHHHTAACCP